MGHYYNANSAIEDEHTKVRHVMARLRDARAADNSPTLLTILLPASIDMKAWEQKLGCRPQSRVSQEGEYMQNLSRVSDHWQQFEKVAAAAQRCFRQIVKENKGKLPQNGIVMFFGSADRCQDVAFEPPNAVLAPVHLCDSRFHVEYLSAFLGTQVYGFIIIDGNGCLYGTLSGHERRVKEQFSVDLPKKHSKGGQSALRFARLRLEKRHHYLRKVVERARNCFISGESVNVSGLLVAGAAEFSTDLASSSLLDPRLRDVLIATLDISYGGECGFNQAINLSADILKDVGMIKEKRIISNFLGEVAKDRGMHCFGMKDSIAALEMGAVDTLIVWDQFPLQRLVVRNESTDTSEVRFLHPDASFADDAEFQVVESARLVDWIVENHISFGAKLEFITDQSQEGTQMCKGFGGIAGVLRYSVELELDDKAESETTDSDSDFE